MNKKNKKKDFKLSLLKCKHNKFHNLLSKRKPNLILKIHKKIKNHRVNKINKIH